MCIRDSFGSPRRRDSWARIPSDGRMATRHLREPAAPVDAAGGGERVARGARHVARASARCGLGATARDRGATGFAGGAPERTLALPVLVRLHLTAVSYTHLRAHETPEHLV